MREIGAFVLSLSEETAHDDAKMIFEFGKKRWAYRDGTQWFLSKNAKVILCSSSWDDDKREIWEIPEARKLFLSVMQICGLTKKEMKDLLDDESFNLIAACAAMHVDVGVIINDTYYGSTHH